VFKVLAKFFIFALKLPLKAIWLVLWFIRHDSTDERGILTSHGDVVDSSIGLVVVVEDDSESEADGGLLIE
jgi:hypothetical protein